MSKTNAGRTLIRPGAILGLALAASVASDAFAQVGQGGAPGGYGSGRRGQQGGNLIAPPSQDSSRSARLSDPEAHDAVDLFSRLCVSIQGSRDRAVGIVGDGDTSIEKMEPPLLRGMENGKNGGIGWIIRMPLGEKLLLEFPPDGTCVVRAPRVNPGQLEIAFHNLLDQYGGSGQFDIKREGEQTKTVDPPGSKGPTADGETKPNDDRHRSDNKLKYHIVVYSMKLPDVGRTAQLVVATTDSTNVSVQGVLSYDLLPANQGSGRP